MPAPDSIKHLLDTFDNNLGFYKSGQYNEAQLRQEFLDPFFAELGWDMDNTAGLAPQYRDVIHEASIKAGSSTKAPDYAFSIHGQYKFFLEAKKPAVNVRDDTEPAYQLRRYGWSAKLPVSILTDFEEFAIYDCRTRPRPGDLPSTARLNYFKYTDYLEKWDELCATFSKQAILTGSFDKYTGDAKRHRGIETVDNAFLAEIEKWRNLLARNFALRNPTLSVRDLNFAVQKTIDRIIFLRICEDRGAENYKRLATLLDSGDIYRRLLDQFMQADARYNSGLFHFSAERGRGAPDNITPGLILDDKALKAIISTLYYPESPYEFSVLPADILGQIYEQFLGKTIRLTAGHQARIEEKPEVRKAGGVYYTPGYIVDYIVTNTLGRLLDGSDPKTPKPIAVAKAAEIKVLDPACGSGSFLIVAYQYLLDWHLRRYTADPNTNEPDHGRIQNHSAGKNPRIHQTARGQWKLTTDERKRILLCNIFGVDIDAQAVEVTKLSLLLKVIEGEAHQADWVRRRERILPDLGNNIKCGNSLIGPEFYHNEQMLLLDEETQYRVNVFDWKQGFSEIMERGGFDCVIGNPPYLNIDNSWGKNDLKLEYLKSNYSNIYNDKTDLLFYFVALSLDLSRNQIGMIISRAFIEAFKADKLRREILSRSQILEIIDFRNFNVFKGVGIATSIITLDCSRVGGNTVAYHYKDVEGIPQLKEKSQNSFNRYERDLSMLDDKPWVFGSIDTLKLYGKIDELGFPLGSLTKLGKGMETGSNSVFGKKVAADVKAMQIPDNLIKKRASNSDIRRYSLTDRGEYILYLEDVNAFRDLPGKLQQYLTSQSEKLKKRAAFKRGNCDWWKYTWPLHRDFYDKPRILCPYLAKNNRFTITHGFEFIGLTDTSVIFDCFEQLNALYVLGILNSRLLNFRFKGIGKLKGGGIYEYIWNSITKIPIRPIDFGNPEDKAKHDKIVTLVEGMLELNKKKTKEKNPETLRRLETRITATDRQIDRLVYDLYDLTAGEIALVESDRSAL